jgi:L-malate glycosyltransferase
VVGHLAALLSQHYDVDFINGWKEYTLQELAMAFDLDLSKVRERKIPELKESFAPTLRSFFSHDGCDTKTFSESYDLFIYSGSGIPPPCFARGGIVYCHFPFESSPLIALKRNVRWLRQNPFGRLIKAGAYRFMWRTRMQGYQRILANSQFTAGWIKQLWGRSAEVLYPPVDLELPVMEKRNLIVSVGRFAGRGRSKNQLEQVQAFREFLKQVQEPWILRIIGSCGESVKDRDYLETVRMAAFGLPVELYVNVERQAVILSLAAAKLFWHTTGVSTDETALPGHAEHFGIATVEAMRAGCVPVVIESGGQREIVENGVSGFLAKDLDELVRESVALARDDELVSPMSDCAKQRSMAFTRDIFEQRIMSVVSQCLNH